MMFRQILKLLRARTVQAQEECYTRGHLEPNSGGFEAGQSEGEPVNPPAGFFSTNHGIRGSVALVTSDNATTSLETKNACQAEDEAHRSRRLRLSDAAAAACIFAVCCLLFWRGLRLYFIQDDFIYLWFTKNQSLHGFLQLFANKSAGFYRPISTYLYFFVLQWLFGVNAFPYHLANLLIHISNSLLLAYLVYLLTKSRVVAFASALIFATRVGHVISVYWICVTTQSMTLMFFLLSLIFYVHHWKAGGRRNLFLSYFFFALCAFSNVNGPALVLIFTVFDVLIRREVSVKAIVRREAAFYCIVVFFLIIQFAVIGYDPPGEYSVLLKPEALKNFGALNVFAYNFLFLLDYYTAYPPTMIPFGIVIGAATIAGSVFWYIRDRRRPEGGLLLLFGFWYVWGFLPYLPLTRHLWLGDYIWPQYITMPAVGLAFVLAWTLTRLLRPRLLAVALCGILLLSYFSVQGFDRLEYDTKGTVYKSELARNVIGDLQKNLAIQPNAKRIVILNSDVSLWWILHYGRNFEVFSGVYRPIFYYTGPTDIVPDSDSLVLRFEGMHLYRVQ